jgi:hypothetical protein
MQSRCAEEGETRQTLVVQLGRSEEGTGKKQRRQPISGRAVCRRKAVHKTGAVGETNFLSRVAWPGVCSAGITVAEESRDVRGR